MSIERIRITRYALLLGLIAYTVGCSDNDSTDPSIDGEDGQVTFIYDGSGFTGVFNADGPLKRDSRGVVDNTFATAIDMIQPLSYLEVYGVEFDLPVLHTINIAISGKEMREYTVASTETCASAIQQRIVGCAAIWYELGLNSEGRPQSTTTRFELISGTLVIESLNAFRVTGSFSGTARQLSGDPFGDRYVPDVTVEITNGVFDVPILSQARWEGVAQLIPEGQPLLR